MARPRRCTESWAFDSRKWQMRMTAADCADSGSGSVTSHSRPLAVAKGPQDLVKEKRLGSSLPIDLSLVRRFSFDFSQVPAGKRSGKQSTALRRTFSLSPSVRALEWTAARPLRGDLPCQCIFRIPNKNAGCSASVALGATRLFHFCGPIEISSSRVSGGYEGVNLVFGQNVFVAIIVINSPQIAQLGTRIFLCERKRKNTS
jgi:hypothetical protein